ncbi:MAG: DUF3800 domain-containing protein [Halioglobus sp.]|nr:DUF3800 domain-containing protein [Halioglobus sp.]
MSDIYNVYCDESCHLENDRIPVMVVGGCWCPKNVSGKIARDIRAIKLKHGLGPKFEIKWTKVSPAKRAFYLELVDYFFGNPELNFRAVVVSKDQLNHERFGQDHSTFYYKMFFYVLRNILEYESSYFVYLDIKDTQGQEKVEKLREVLSTANYDFDRNGIKNIQQVHSHEIEQLQLADLFIGALSYLHRKLDTNDGKLAVIERIKQCSGKRLICSTLPSERKFNVFLWEGR